MEIIEFICLELQELKLVAQGYENVFGNNQGILTSKIKGIERNLLVLNNFLKKNKARIHFKQGSTPDNIQLVPGQDDTRKKMPDRIFDGSFNPDDIKQV